MVLASRTIATCPFQKIRSPRCNFFISAGLSARPSPSCCMSLSRGQPVPAAFSADLHQAGAIDAEAALAAPEIGRADETFGDRDEIVLDGVETANMPARQIPAFAGHRERAVFAHDRYPRFHRQRVDRRQFDRRARKCERAQCRDFVRRVGHGPDERGIRQPADIAVAVQLPPGKTFGVAVIDRDALALQRLRQQHGIAGWRFAQRRECFGDLELLACHKARGLDLALEIFRGDIAAGRRQARIIHSVRSTICRSRAPPGIRRLRGEPALPTASSHRYRHAASSWPVRQSAAGTARR